MDWNLIDWKCCLIGKFVVSLEKAKQILGVSEQLYIGKRKVIKGSKLEPLCVKWCLYSEFAMKRLNKIKLYFKAVDDQESSVN